MSILFCQSHCAEPGAQCVCVYEWESVSMRERAREEMSFSDHQWWKWVPYQGIKKIIYIPNPGATHTIYGQGLCYRIKVKVKTPQALVLVREENERNRGRRGRRRRRSRKGRRKRRRQVHGLGSQEERSTCFLFEPSMRPRCGCSPLCSQSHGFPNGPTCTQTPFRLTLSSTQRDQTNQRFIDLESHCQFNSWTSH